MLERGFLNFLNFFWNFLAGVQCERNSGLKFYSPFLCLSQPVLAENIVGKRFFTILNFFALFFRNFLNRVEYERNSRLKFFFSSSPYLIPFWLGIMPERGFLIFWIFLLFFSEFSCRGPIWAEFGPKIFFSLSRPISSRFGLKYCLNKVF